MAKDKLFLITPGFTDPKRDDGPFICPFCNQVEGLLASFPELAKKVDVERVDFVRPRGKVIDILGEENQGLPVLILGDDPPIDAKSANGYHFIGDTRRILELLAERHGFPKLH
ncbi:hypothetical protein GCM10007913_13970 [Devosia yakushimensis]|uniref:DUF3088 domain-containing protein n=1 Tax=Devosia yakushimensis TaxID=470028 RepID=A0ABQ5UBG8_9HYPH|nr:DUF3088 domain-containing protein [Devosia yakushimensis]GLQ09465.1 hypothetical protein GCM10007913_13970 [Devosia yakushimensis]